MPKKLYAILLLLFAQFTAVSASAQTSDALLVDEENKEEPTLHDTTTLLHAFRKGTFEGRFHCFFMSALNEGSLSNFIMPMPLGVVSSTKLCHSVIFNLGWVGFTPSIWFHLTWQSPVLSPVRPIAMKLDYSRYKILRRLIICTS